MVMHFMNDMGTFQIVNVFADRTLRDVGNCRAATALFQFRNTFPIPIMIGKNI